MVFTVLLGLWAQTARQLDEGHVHVVCPEHGELIEQVHHAGPKHAQISADVSVVHGEGCLLGWAAPSGALCAPPPPLALEHPEAAEAPTPVLGSASGVVRPVLADAPKTSPPRA